jgi:hypothetical protein
MKARNGASTSPAVAKLALVLFAAGFLCALPQPSAIAQGKAPTKAPVLLMQTAKDIAFKNGVLTLRHLSPVTVCFSDRVRCGPAREESCRNNSAGGGGPGARAGRLGLERKRLCY